MTPDVDLIEEAKRNWHARRWGAVEAMAAATSISRANQILLGRINDELAPLGLTFSRYEALVLISFSRSGELPMGKIGERLQVHPASVTNTIDRLERDGLVERRPHPSDRRGTLAAITDTGRALVEEATEKLERIRFGLDDVDDGDAVRVFDALRPLRRSAGDL